VSSLQIEALCVKLHSVEVLRGISLKLAPGEMIGLLGGRITCAGENLLALPTHRRTALGIGYMPEDRRLIPQLTVQENVLLPGWVTRGVNAAARLDFVYGLMPEVAAMRDRKAMALSGGQQKLVALARALIVGTRLLLLDEPFEGVAPALSRRLAEVIGLLRGEDIAVLIAQSDLNHTISLLDREYRIERGANR
jgi:branched-chain amino acid transport system ATP-binding protein